MNFVKKSFEYLHIRKGGAWAHQYLYFLLFATCASLHKSEKFEKLAKMASQKVMCPQKFNFQCSVMFDKCP